MQMRALIAVNVVLAAALAVFAWAILPFAQGVRCEAASIACQPVTLLHRTVFAAAPATVVLFIAWFGAALFRRSRFGGYLALAFCPLVTAGWVFIVWSGHGL